MSIRPSVNKFFLSNLNEIWHVGRGRWVIHDGMPYDLIQGQGHGGLKCAKMADFKGYLIHQYACNQKTNIRILPLTRSRPAVTYTANFRWLLSESGFRHWRAISLQWISQFPFFNWFLVVCWLSEMIADSVHHLGSCIYELWYSDFLASDTRIFSDYLYRLSFD